MDTRVCFCHLRELVNSQQNIMVGFWMFANCKSRPVQWGLHKNQQAKVTPDLFERDGNFHTRVLQRFDKG